MHKDDAAPVPADSPTPPRGADADLRALLDAATHSAFLMDTDGLILSANAALARRLGIGLEAVVGANAYDLIPSRLVPSRRAQVERLLATRRPVEFVDERAGTFQEHRLVPVLDADGRVVRIAVFAEDITERLTAEKALRAAHDKLEAFWGIASLTDADLKTVCDHILSSIARMTGSEYGFYGFINDDESEMVIHAWSGEAMQDCSLVAKPRHYPIRSAGLWAEAIRRREPFILNDYAAPHAGKTGLPEGHVPLTRLLVVPFFQEARITAIAAVANRPAPYGPDDISQIAAFLAGVQAIADNKRSEAALRKSEALLNTAQRLTRLGGWEWDVERGSMYWTREIYRIHDFPGDDLPGGATEHVVRSLACYDPGDRETVREAFERCCTEGVPYDLEVRFTSAAGRRLWVRTTAEAVSEEGRIVKVIGNIMDITDRKEAEEQRLLLQRQVQLFQKSESLGRMAGAIAHHFNNLLGAVMGNLELALEDQPDGGEAEWIHQAMLAARRAADLSGSMLTYLGQTPGGGEKLDLAEVCRRSLPMLRAAVPPKASLKADLPAAGPLIRGNPDQILQILANLLTNAWEALGDRDPADQVVHLRVCTVPAQDISRLRHFPVDWRPPDGDWACLEVADSGCGISEEKIGSIFDPFYTDKFTGRGLGLSVVLGIVRAAGGAVAVESEPGRGSRFRVCLPLLPETGVQQAEAVPAGATVGMEPGGAILLIDDEPMVRTLARTMLLRIGFAVVEAADAAAAVQRLREDPPAIRCVLCDLTMPGMDGWETLAALRRIVPGIPAVLASGYDKSRMMDGEHAEWPQAFLEKPYQRADLEDALRRALGARKGLEQGRTGGCAESSSFSPSSGFPAAER